MSFNVSESIFTRPKNTKNSDEENGHLKILIIINKQVKTRRYFQDIFLHTFYSDIILLVHYIRPDIILSQLTLNIHRIV